MQSQCTPPKLEDNTHHGDVTLLNKPDLRKPSNDGAPYFPAFSFLLRLNLTPLPVIIHGQ